MIPHYYIHAILLIYIKDASAFILSPLPQSSSPSFSLLSDKRSYVEISTSTIQMLSSESIGIDKSVNKVNNKELTLDTIIEMLDVTFVNACLQLSKGYIDILKLFIVSVQTAYKMNVSIENLIQGIDNYTNEISKAANRNLAKEEILLRTAWIYLIYLTLDSLQIPKNIDTLASSSPSMKDNEKYNIDTRVVLNDIQQMYQKYITYIVQNGKINNNQKTKFSIVSDLKVDDVLQNCQDITGTTTTTLDDAMDTMMNAMLPQNIRVIILTLVVLEEEKLCLDSGNSVPSPPIPGTR